MKFFDRILGALGFDVEDNSVKKPKKSTKMQKNRIGEVDLQSSKKTFEAFDWQEKMPKTSNQTENLPAEKNFATKTTEKNFATENASAMSSQQKNESSIVKIVPQNQNEVQCAMDILKGGKNVVIDLSVFKSTDVLRALDFISGVCYCLNARIQRLNETTFALTLQKES